MPRKFRIERLHAEMVSKGTMFRVLEYLDSNDVRTPTLLLDKDQVRRKARLIGSKIRNSRVFYAVKANPDMDVVRFMEEQGLGFEIASDGELKLLEDLGVSPDRIISSNPVKTFQFIEAAARYGVKYFSYDSIDEVHKIAAKIPDAKLYLRLSVPNEGSEWPLSKKFGVELDEALPLLRAARDAGLTAAGITFHVGSQCLNKYNWNSAIYKAAELWNAARAEGLPLTILNIGGGYPINYTKSVVGIEDIEANIDRLIGENFPPDTEIFIEPGRAMVGDAGVFVTQVHGKATRGDERWLYIDVGVFNGLMESIGGIKYCYVVEDIGLPDVKTRFTVSGPSCDSFDVIAKEVPLHEPPVGALVLILSAGAYTISYASEFNGFAIPKTTLI